jgi:hypothetical protein
MKRIFLIVTLLIGTFIYSNGQTKSKSDSIKAANKAAGLNKDGTPDMRLKANKQATKAKKSAQPSATPAPTAQTPVTPVPKVSAQTPALVTPKVASQTQAKPVPNSTTGKVFGTDAKGRTIYEGPRGGHYIINSKGNKEYVKKT